MSDRTLNFFRHVVGPVLVAAVSGYWAMRVAQEKTRASYEALAPAVRDLQDDITYLRGRVEELSKQQTSRLVAKVESKPTATQLPIVTVEVEKPAQSKKPAAKFDDMLKGL